MDSAPLPPLRAFDAREVRQCNRLNAAGVIPLQVEDTVMFAACAAEPADAARVPEHAVAVDVPLTQGLLHLILPRALLHVLVLPRVAPAPVDALTEEELLQHIIRLFDGLLRMYETKHGTRPLPTLTLPRPLHTVPLKIFTKEGGIFPVRAGLNDNLITLAGAFTAAARPSPPRAFPIDVRILADRRPLARRALHTLQPGAVVLLSPGRDPLHAPLGICGDDTLIPLQGDDVRVHVVGPPQRSVSEESSVSDHPFADAPVQVQFVLARLTVPADRLLHMNNGYVFDLDKPLSEAAKAVELVVNNRTIARGETVRVGESYGVLIHEVY